MKANEIEQIVRATIEAMDKLGGEIGFMESVRHFNLGEEKLELWINAYEEGGLSGIRALTEPFSLDQEIVRSASKQIHDFFQATWPSWEYKVGRRYNCFTISIKKTGDSDFEELCQLRFTPFDDRWHLYWKKDNGKWFPYVPDEEDFDGLLWKALYLLKLDDFGCFFE